MAYTPTEWETGDVITAEKLNKMETGIAANSAGMIIPTFTPNAGLTSATCDMTLQEILSAIDAKRCFFAKVLTGDSISFFPLAGYNTEQATEYVDFSLVSVSPAGVVLMRVLYESEGITLVQQLYPDTP